MDVSRAPKPSMLRHRNDEQPVGSKSLIYASYDFMVFFDVFEYVERPDRIKLIHIGKITGVQLDKFDSGQSSLG